MLTLPIKGGWFDMIRANIKPEEYRDMTPYYIARLQKYVGKGPTCIKLRNGYRKDSPTITILCEVTTGFGRPEWGANPEKECYVLRIYVWRMDDEKN